MVAHYFVYLRPGLTRFLESVAMRYNMAVWTSSSEDYARETVDFVFEKHELDFVWARRRCTKKFDPSLYEEYWIKDLKKVRKRGYDLDRVIMVDDTPRKLQRNYGNLVRVSEWTGSLDDVELEELAPYLCWLSEQENTTWQVKCPQH